MQWQGALVVKGAVHCRLSNITPEGTWRVTEKYVYAGKEYVRIAGQSAGRCMQPYRDLREKYPELFEGLEVYSQPAAVVDSIIMKWMLQEQAEAFPCSIWCRDMLAAGHAMQTKLVQAAGQQIGCRVYGGVTCLVQVTDTDHAWSFKAGVSAAQAEERKEQNVAAKAAGVVCTMKCGPREIMKIIHAAHAAQEKRAGETGWIVKALRRNGYLHWRPDLQKMEMVESSMQDWAADKPEGSYRFPSRWLEERGDWLKDGRPERADLEAIADAEKLAAELEVDYSRKEGYTQVVKSQDGLKLKDAHAVIECDEVQNEGDMGASNAERMDPKVARRLKKADRVLQDPDALEALKKQKQAKKKDKQVKKARRVILKQGRERLKDMLKTMTRREAMEAMLVEAGKSKKKKQKKETEEGEEKEEGVAKIKFGKMMQTLKGKMKQLQVLGVVKKKNLKTKPAAKKKPSIKQKPSAKMKPAALKKSIKKELQHTRKKIRAAKKYVKKAMKEKTVEKWSIMKKHMKKDELRMKVQLVAFRLRELEELEKDDAAEAATVEAATEELAAMEACIEGTEVQVVSEFAGRGKFGKPGEVVELEGHEALVDFQPGVQRLNADWIAEHQPFSKWKKMKNMRELKRPDLLKILQV